MWARLLILATIAIAPHPARASWEVITHEGRRYVPMENVANFYKMAILASTPSFQLTGPNRSISGQPGARHIQINGVKYMLCFPTIKKNGRILVSVMDVTKIIEPVLRPQKIKNPTPIHTVILDPGHGGHDPGARGYFGWEKTAALDVALRARRLLEAKGYTVKLTRSTDVFIPLERRTAFANSFKNAVLVSIHFNKSRNATGSGIETFCLAPRGVPSMDDENLSYSDFQPHPGHARDPENIALAAAVHASLVRRSILPDRGIKRARFHVIRNAKIPSVLVEGGFMDNPLDARLINSPTYRQNMASAIAHGIDQFRLAVSRNSLPNLPSEIANSTNPSLETQNFNPRLASERDHPPQVIEALSRSLTN